MNTHEPHDESMGTQPDTRWVPAFEASALAPGESKPFRRDAYRLLVMRTEEGDLHAVSALCPHEGYSLAQGQLKSCVLTCAWHNFKFDVRTGAALMGDESVHTFPVRERSGTIEVGLTPRNLSTEIPKHFDGLATAIYRGRLGQGIRDAARLLHAGVPAADVLLAVVAEAMARSEYGGGHEPALAADLLVTLADHPGIEAAVVVAQVVELATDSARGLPRYCPGSAATMAMSDEAIIEAVELEDQRSAESGLLERLGRVGPIRSAFEPLFLRLSAAHFLDFGHATIYATKVFDLLEAATDKARNVHGMDVLVGLLRGVVNGTREDTLPPWKLVPRFLAEHEGQMWAWWEANRPQADHDTKRSTAGLDDLERAMTSGRPGEVLDHLKMHMQNGVGVEAIGATILAAGAARLGAFDPAIDVDPSLREGWLFATHVFTHAQAVMVLIGQLSHPDVLRHLIYAAFFINRYKALDKPSEQAASANAQEASVGKAMAAIRSGDGDQAAGLIATIGNTAELRDAVRQWYLDDPATRPIVVTHLIKVAEAAFAAHEQLREAGHPDANRALTAMARLMSGPIRERPVRRAANEAIALVRDGRTPPRLVT